MSNFFHRFQQAAVQRIASPDCPEIGSLAYFRAQILFSVLSTALLLGAFASVSGITVAIKENAWGLVFVDCAGYLVGIYLLASKRLGYEFRAIVTLMMAYAVGMVVILSVGPLSGGAAWLFAFAVLTAVLLGFKPAIGAIALNAGSLMLIAWLVLDHRIAVDFVFFETPQAMLAAGINFLVLNAIVAVSVASLVQGLVDTYEKKSALTERLRQERRQLIEAKEALGESEEKYRHFVDNAPMAMYTINTKGEFTYGNKKLMTITGYRIEDWLNKPFHPIVHPDDLPIVAEKISRRLSGKGDPEPYEIRIYHASGSVMWVEIVSESILQTDENGEFRLIGMQAFVTDVTAKKEAEDALRDSEEKYRDLVRHAPAGIYEFDVRTMRFISVNDVMCQYTGYTENEFLEHSLFETLGKDSQDALARLLADLQSEKPREVSTEWRIERKNETGFWGLVNLRFFYADGLPVRGMAVVHDLTAIHHAEAERRRLEIELQHAKKLESLGTLAGGVAHDLNNILSGVVSYPDLLLMDLESDSPLREPLMSIKRSGEKAAEIVQDLLTLARRGVASRSVIDLNRIVSDFMVSVECSKLLETHSKVSIESRLGEEIFNIVGSEVHISKSVMNLVTNAVDAMPAGGRAVISTRSCYLDTEHNGYESIPEGEYTVLETSDTGIGISKTDLERIFEPFYTKKSMGRSGTGLGMSVVWGTLKDHDGFIDIATEEGTGTVISLYFPASRLETQTTSTVHVDDYLGNGESLLIVDDSPEQRALAQRMLKRLRYKVSTAASGEAAISMVEKRPYDLLILDMIMPPGMNGLETYKRIREISDGQKAVIASGYAMSDHVQEAQHLGAGAYVKKPFTLETIGLAVRAELDSRPRREA